ncbi:MAG TPA: CPBP family intramembrane glutamic endopeptidase [Planctomycetaceae bacterium]|nr:CPBP family intramembrane glutamic endopeptidase [Planctomycetaceae bacterium]
MSDAAPLATSLLDPAAIEAPPTPLAITDFVDDEPLQTKPKRLPGPGLPEACAWSFGVVFAHIVSSLPPLILIGILLAASGMRPEALTNIENLAPSHLLILLGGDQWIFVLLVVAAVAVRWGRATTSRLNLTPLRPLHFALIAGMVLPLSIVAGEVYRVVDLAWQPLLRQFPVLEALDASNAVELLAKASNAGSLPVMLLIIAVAPAISEELVFRGMVGRGLVARWGVMIGVSMSSLMFAAVHLHPVHAAAVLPIGFVLHLAYLTTRSFWAPVLLHFLNNAWATIATRLQDGDAMETMKEPTSGLLLLASGVAIAVLGAMLYRTRIRYWLPDGTEWDPGYVTAERPPAGLATYRASASESGRSLAISAIVWISFAVTFAAEIAAAR